MRSNCSRAYVRLDISTLLIFYGLLLLSLSAQECSNVNIKVTRGTNRRAEHGGRLQLECPIELSGSCQIPSPSWYKDEMKVNETSTITTKWSNKKNGTVVFLLMFTHILPSDSGTYNCRTKLDQGHYISVNVTGNAMHDSGFQGFMPYIWTAVAILMCIIAVIFLSVLFKRRCQGNVQRQDHAENQYTEMPLSRKISVPSNPVQAAAPCDTPPAMMAPDRIHGNVPSPHCRAKQPRAHQAAVSGDNGDPHGNGAARGRRVRGGRDQEEPSVLYAALNHQVAPVAPRLVRDREEATEYVAISFT